MEKRNRHRALFIAREKEKKRRPEGAEFDPNCRREESVVQLYDNFVIFLNLSYIG